MKKILSIDYGRKNLGFAFTEFLIPDPLDGIKVQDSASLLQAALDVVADFNPELIIVGLPEGELAKEVQEFASDIQSSSGVITVLHPETLSTHDAVIKLRESGAKRKKLSNNHSYAAALILEDYLISSGS